jgi:hypothetical protein
LPPHDGARFHPLRKWRQATTAPVGTNQHSDNVTTLKPERGNSLAYTLAG